MNAYKANNRMNEKAQELCTKLYLAAKKSKTRRFHQLYDKIHRIDILTDAWKIVKANKGCAGIDGITVDDIIKAGETEYLQKIHECLLDTHDYHPTKIRRVFIPKADGKQRPLGIPTIKDRIVQTSAKLMLEPIFEADFLDCSYGFRPNRNAHEALEQIRLWTNKGYNFVIDADIKGYFDNINHEKLLNLVHQRVSDRKTLKLIRKWLKSGVAGELKRNEIGTPQGGVISPLLANIYLHEFDKFWQWQTYQRGVLIRYADDFVILCKTKKDAEIGLRLVEAKMKELNLVLNKEKTKIVDITNGKESFNFLGFEHRKIWSWKYHRLFTQKYPKRASVKKLKEKIRIITDKRAMLKVSTEEMTKLLNPILRGWMNYFRYGNSSKTFNKINSYVHEKLALWWSKKHHKSGRNWKSSFTGAKLKETGIVIMRGIKYWSKL